MITDYANTLVGLNTHSVINLHFLGFFPGDHSGGTQLCYVTNITAKFDKMGIMNVAACKRTYGVRPSCVQITVKDILLHSHLQPAELFTEHTLISENRVHILGE